MIYVNLRKMFSLVAFLIGGILYPRILKLPSWQDRLPAPGKATDIAVLCVIDFIKVFYTPSCYHRLNYDSQHGCSESQYGKPAES